MQKCREPDAEQQPSPDRGVHQRDARYKRLKPRQVGEGEVLVEVAELLKVVIVKGIKPK